MAREPLRPFGVVRDQRGTTMVLRVHGDVDLATAPKLAIDAAEAIRAGNDLVIDLAPATFLDSTGLSVLLNACRRAARADVSFAVVCPEGPIRRSLAIHRLERAFAVRDTEDESSQCGCADAG